MLDSDYDYKPISNSVITHNAHNFFLAMIEKIRRKIDNHILFVIKPFQMNCPMIPILS